MPDLAFVLVRQAVPPDPQRVLASAQARGIRLTHAGGADDMLTFDGVNPESLIVAVMPAPYPDAARVPEGPTSPPADQAAAAPAHLILTALGLKGAPRDRDTTMAILTAAVIDNVDAVGAMLGHGVVFHKAQLFADMATHAAQAGEPLPSEVAIDVTAEQESPSRMSFLTHHMPRYGREDIYLTCPIQGKGALDFIFGLSRWLLADPDKHLPTGDTVGRTAEEKLVVQRVPDPRGSGTQVIRLDLP